MSILEDFFNISVAISQLPFSVDLEMACNSFPSVNE